MLGPRSSWRRLEGSRRARVTAHGRSPLRPPFCQLVPQVRNLESILHTTYSYSPPPLKVCILSSASCYYCCMFCASCACCWVLDLVLQYVCVCMRACLHPLHDYIWACPSDSCNHTMQCQCCVSAVGTNLDLASTLGFSVLSKRDTSPLCRILAILPGVTVSHPVYPNVAKWRHPDFLSTTLCSQIFIC